MADHETAKTRNRETSDRERAQEPAVCEARPVHLTVGNTHKCNLDCPMCFKHYEEGHNMSYPTMPLEMFRGIAQDAFGTADRVTLTVSGDALVSENIEQELAIGGEFGVTYEITTNGLMLGREPLTGLLLDHCSVLTISFDGATAATYEKIRQGGKFEKATAAVRSFADAKAAAGHGPLLAAMTVLQKDNVDELPDWVRLMTDLGVETLGVDHIVVPDFDTSPSCIHDRAGCNARMAEAAAVAEECGVALRLPPPYLTDETSEPPTSDQPAATDAPPPDGPVTAGRVRCPYVWSETWIGYDGTVSPCCNVAYTDKMGSVAELPFSEIWNGAAYTELRRSLAEGDPPQVCRDCHLAIREVETGETYVKRT